MTGTLVASLIAVSDPSSSPTSLVWGAAAWRLVAIPGALSMLVLLVWGYARARSIDRSLRILAPAVKLLGIAILALCLLEPLFSGTRARPGANLFVVLADNSRSMTLKDRDATESRAEQLRSLTHKPGDAPWLTRIGQDFDLRQYAFDTQLRAAPELQSLSFDGSASNLAAALQRITNQYEGRPLAGVIVLTDGTATDADAIDRVLVQAGASAQQDQPKKLPPIYPVMLGRETPADDVSVKRVAVSQTNFEDAPVTLAAQIAASGYRGRTVAVELLDESGKILEQQKLIIEKDDATEPLTARFRVKPEHAGVSFYRVRVSADGQPSTRSSTGEATSENNSRLVAVDRGKGPYRVLYVAGRPNWEYKFLQRSVETDDQVKLVGLLRVAKREPKFNFISHAGERSNPLFRGFQDGDKEQVEDYDQPVIVRVNVKDESELRGGFPKSADELYGFHAIILDDVESEFFTQDQMLLIKEFVRQRGGGFLMLGGQETFRNGKYDRTPIGDLLPVYVDDPILAVPASVPFPSYRMTLTREGWLEPWVRLRSEEDAERRRLNATPQFLTYNGVRAIKPGATVLATASVEEGPGAEQVGTLPALVEQRFGRGRAGALLIGDLWRWTLRRPPNAEDDLAKAWRQAVRWLVSDVPQRVEVAVAPQRETDDAGEGAVTLSVKVRDATYGPQDNANVTLRVTTPDKQTLELPAEPSAREAGLYEAVYVPRQPGAYRAEVRAATAEGDEIAKVEAGWTSDPAAEEFQDLKPNRALLERIAKSTGGQLVAPDELEAFAKTLPTRHADVTEPYVRPAWHQPWVLALAVLCVCAEWGLRRWKGLP